jgi:hypothetical protein
MLSLSALGASVNQLTACLPNQTFRDGHHTRVVMAITSMGVAIKVFVRHADRHYPPQPVCKRRV